MKFKLFPVVLVLVFGFLTTSVLAANERSAAAREGTASPIPPPRGKSGLAAGKLIACQAQEKVIQKRLVQLNRLVVNMEGKFDAIALRVENFYTAKVLPTKALPNYSALTAEIGAKKVLVQTALAKAQTDSVGFSCTGGDPKGLLNQYRLDMQAVKKALGDYRTSIKNLIVAVHTLVGDTETPKPSESPEATGTAVPTATL